MQCEKLFNKIDDLYEQYLDVWETVCNMESPTMDKERVDAVGKYYIDIAEKKGWKVEVFESVTGNVVCLTMNPDAKKEPISLSAHIDTVHPVGSFGTPAVKRDNEKIYGPGVVDCKGGLVSALYAMDALEQTGFSDRPVMYYSLSSNPHAITVPKRDITLNKSRKLGMIRMLKQVIHYSVKGCRICVDVKGKISVIPFDNNIRISF